MSKNSIIIKNTKDVNQVDTIIACATAFPAAIATIRISGSKASYLLDICFTSKLQKQHRVLRVGQLEFDGIRDKATAVFFNSPQSYTGEDMAEITIHGSAALAERLIMFLISKGARAAEAGEFTKRAFFSGKMDLSSAEGVLGLINAESDGEMVAAYNDMQGGLRRSVEGLQAKLLKVMAAMEAAIDFPEEAGVETYGDFIDENNILNDLNIGNNNSTNQTNNDEDNNLNDGKQSKSGGYGFKQQIKEIADEIKTLADGYKSGRLIREGVKIAVIGGVNVGKSSLVNALLKKNRAIVTDIPGTTRDTLEDRYQHGGYKFVITDTAGLREGGGTIERMGMERSMQAAAESDIVLAVCEAGRELETQAQQLLKEWGASEKNKENTVQSTNEIKVIFVENKTDIYPPKMKGSIRISAKTGENIDALKDKILQASGVANGGGKVITNLRHYEALEFSYQILRGVLADGIPPECVASDLMAAYNQIGRITGAVGSDEVIDRIFSDFCVGK